MVYEFPPRPMFFPQTGSWFILAGSFAALTVGILVAAAVFYRRAYHGRPCRKWTPLIWLSVGILHFCLASIVLVEPDISHHGDSPSLLYLTGSPFVWFLVLSVVLHSAWALQQGNDPSILRSTLVLYGCIVMGYLVVSLQFLPALRKGPFTYRIECRFNGNYMWYDIKRCMRESGRVDWKISEGNNPPHSWRTELLVVSLGAHEHYDVKQPWDAAANRIVGPDWTPYLVCPSTPLDQQRDPHGVAYTAWAAVIGPDTMFPNGKGIQLDDVKDGSSNTVLLAEAVGQQIPWMEPRDVEVTKTNIGINLPSNRKFHSPAVFSSYHYPQGAHAVMVDGSVRFLNQKTDRRVLEDLIKRHDGNRVRQSN